MKEAFPFLLVLAALVVTLFSLFGEDGFAKQHSMERTLERERERNLALQEYVDDLDDKVHRLEHDDRELEKTARNKLGMARPDELIFFFDKRPQQGKLGHGTLGKDKTRTERQD